MFEERAIVYFDPFYFKNGNPAKPKYFLVLRLDGDRSVLASLPTRTDSIPVAYENETGCIEKPEINLNCFVISANEAVTECGKSFDFKTHMYGHQLDEYEVKVLEDIYPIKDSDYFIWGRMKQSIFNKLIDCLRSSKSVKRKFKKILN